MEEEKQETKEEKKSEDNVIYIGKKPSMAYVLAAVTQFGDGQEKIHIKARGKAISKAVDVTEIVRNRFVPNTVVEDIKIGTETVKGEQEDKDINVSTIEIVLKKQ